MQPSTSGSTETKKTRHMVYPGIRNRNYCLIALKQVVDCPFNYLCSAYDPCPWLNKNFKAKLVAKIVTAQKKSEKFSASLKRYLPTMLTQEILSRKVGIISLMCLTVANNPEN
jgi:hypothetical protein